MNKKYLIPVLISVVTIGFLVFIGLMQFANTNSISDGFKEVFILRTISPGLYMIIVLSMLLVGSILGAIVFGYLLGPLFLYIHKNTIGRKMIYGITNVDDPTPNKFKGGLKSLFPALMALNFAIMIGTNDTVKGILMTPTHFNNPIYLLMIVMFFLGLMGFIGIGLFSPVWMLLDSGIVYSNENKVREKQIPMEARSVGGWYLYLMKGYAGVSVIITFYELISALINTGEADLVGIIFFVLIPFVIMLFMLPALIVVDYLQGHRKKFLLKYANKYGITEQVTISFQK